MWLHLTKNNHSKENFEIDDKILLFLCCSFLSYIETNLIQVDTFFQQVIVGHLTIVVFDKTLKIHNFNTFTKAR